MAFQVVVTTPPPLHTPTLFQNREASYLNIILVMVEHVGGFGRVVPGCEVGGILTGKSLLGRSNLSQSLCCGYFWFGKERLWGYL